LSEIFVELRRYINMTTAATALAGTQGRLGYPTYPTRNPQLARKPDILRPIPAEVEAIRAQIPIVAAAVSKNLGEAIAILSDPRLISLAGEIEGIAKQLSQALLVGDIRYSMLKYYHAVPEDFGIFDEEVKSLIQHLTFEEAGQIEVLQKLQRGELRELIASRKSGYCPPPQTEELKSLFVKKIFELKGFFALINLSESPITELSMRIKEEITDPNLKKQLLDESSTLLELELFMGHDMYHCFSTKFLSGQAFWKKDAWTPLFECNLQNFSRLTCHLRHLTSILIVSKHRADKKTPILERTNLAEVVYTAAHAIGFRLHMPINHTAEFLMGHINLRFFTNITIETVAAFLEAILYQVIKNSMKAVKEAFEDLKKVSLKIDVELKTDEQFPDVAIISVEDNATGFMINRILEKGFALAKELSQKGVVFEENSILAKLLKWGQVPAVVRTFTVGEIIDLAFIQNLSGFGSQSFSSGLGLNEAAEMAQLMDADILMTNTASGGALTSIIIGPREKREQVIARKLGL